jgi:16S rRNA (adenine1518-N6/adenine1519-N6)-dimethyltransferase
MDLHAYWVVLTFSITKFYIVSITPKKSLGQHFLTDGNIIRKIAGAVNRVPNGRVIEIGPGTGAVTRELIVRFPDLEVIEIDLRAIEVLRREMPSLIIHYQDVLETNWNGFSKDSQDAPISVIGNLPYYITSPILFSVLDRRELFHEAVFMMQKEVADRLVAPPGSKTYGILSVQTQLLCRPEYLFTVSRHVFNPKPNVESAVVKLHFDNQAPQCDLVALKRVIRTAFNQRRKTLSNALKTILNERIPDVGSRESFVRDFELSRRAEVLNPHEFVDLTRALFDHS